MTTRKPEELEGVTLLGNQGTNYLFDYAPQVLETFPNKHTNRDYFVKFNCPEFTSLCPQTGDQILRPCISATSQMKSWSKVNH